jgi:hypothetical protein
MGWAGRPGPTSAQFVASFARCCFPSHLYPPPFCMWAIVVSFSPNWTKLLVSQDSALFWLGPRSLSSSRAWSLGYLESCSLHCLTCTGLQGLVMRCLMNLFLFLYHTYSYSFLFFFLIHIFCFISFFLIFSFSFSSIVFYCSPWTLKLHCTYLLPHA